MNLAKYIDHTLLKADCKKSEIAKLCKEALEYGFYSVCVNSSRVKRAASILKGSDVKVCAVVGFPLGASSTKAKVVEAKEAIKAGASEIDMVINIGYLKEKNTKYVLKEIQSIKKAIGDNLLKVIIECCLLTDEEKKVATELVIQGGADYVKTSTGFSFGGATIDDVKLLVASANGKIKVKASGGIRTLNDAKAFIDLGASRLGCSAGPTILKGLESDGNY